MLYPPPVRASEPTIFLPTLFIGFYSCDPISQVDAWSFPYSKRRGCGKSSGRGAGLKLKAEPWTHSSTCHLVCCFFPCPRHFTGSSGRQRCLGVERTLPLHLSKSEVPPLFWRQRGCQDCLEEGNAFLGPETSGRLISQLLLRLSIPFVISPSLRLSWPLEAQG